ncbi:hypothetical protein L1887_63506 [Cichorium endivia]|nr:hypothetical protein L1887_63506 [Cichorium endivia]
MHVFPPPESSDQETRAHLHREEMPRIGRFGKIWERFGKIWDLGVADGGRGSLLDGDRLGQVAREVDVDAGSRGQVVGKQLERHDGQETLEAVDGAGHADGLHALLDVLVVVVADDDGLTLACGDLHEGGLHLGRERAVLELAGEDALRVHVADLLDLERTLEAGGVLVASAHDEQRALLGERVVGERLERLVLCEDALDLGGEGVEAVDDGVPALGHRGPVLAQLDGHHDESNVLRCVGLGGGDADLGAGVDVDTAVSLARHGGADGVDDAETEGAALEAVAEREDGVGGLTGLRDKDADVVTEDGRLAVEEVRGELDRDGDLGELLKDGTGGEARVVRGAAGGHDDSAAAADGVEEGGEAAELDLALVKVDAATHGVDDGLGLLVDLLLHKVVEGALHDLCQLHLERLDGAHGAEAVVPAEAVDVELALGDVGHVVVLEVEDALGVLDDSRGVRGDKVLDGLGQAVLGEEGAGLGAEELVVGVGHREGAGARGVAAGRGEEAGVAETALLDGTAELDVDKVDLELLLGLDADQEGRAASCDDDLAGEVYGLEDKGEGALELLEDGLDERGEVGLAALGRVVEVLAEDGYGLCVGVALKPEATLLEDHAELAEVGDDAVVDDGEFVGGIGPVRVAVDGAWLTVGGPARVGHAHLGDGDLVEVDVRLINVLAEGGDLADLLEDEGVLLRVAVNGDTGTVVASVLETSETGDEDVDDLLAVLLHQVVDVGENAAL